MAVSQDKSVIAAEELRRRSEEQLEGKSGEAHHPPTAAEAQKLVHELEVHQIELEMQNAELLRTRDEMDLMLERYTDLYDFAPVGYLTLDRSGTIKAANLAGASLFGVERARLLGRRVEAFIPVTARPLFADFLGKVFAQPGKVSGELPFQLEGSGPLFLHIDAVADASGGECRIAAIDITERRAAETELAEKKRELEELNRFLEQRIAQAVDELRRKDEMLILQDRFAVMGEMINNIAHQWNQPLNSVGLVVQQLTIYHEMGKLSGELLRENTEKAMELITHMSQTIEDFRNLFKPDKESVAFSVNQVIARTLSLIEKTFQDQGIGVSFQPEDDPVAVGFPNEYSQVLLNILLNARDALLEHQAAPALVSIRAFSEEGRSVVTITDNAGGIAGEILDKLFDAYFTTKGADKGTGIGLFMSKSIIENSMKGRLSVRNVEGGAEFRIEI